MHIYIYMRAVFGVPCMCICELQALLDAQVGDIYLHLNRVQGNSSQHLFHAILRRLYTLRNSVHFISTHSVVRFYTFLNSLPVTACSSSTSKMSTFSSACDTLLPYSAILCCSAMLCMLPYSDQLLLISTQAPAAPSSCSTSCN